MRSAVLCPPPSPPERKTLRILTISEQLGKRDLESLEKDHLTPPDYNKLLAINLISTIILTISILIISCTLRGNYDIDFDISLMFQCFFAHAHLRSGSLPTH